MVFSIDTIKASVNRANNKPNFLFINNDIEVDFIHPVIDENNIYSYKDILLKVITNNISTISNLLNSNNDYYRKYVYSKDVLDTFNTKLNNIGDDTIDFSTVIDTPLYFKNEYKPYVFLIGISHAINNIKSYIYNNSEDWSYDGIDVDVDFLDNYNGCELTKEEIVNRDIFSDCKNKNNRYSCYIKEYCDNLARDIQNLPDIRSIENNRSVNIPKLVSVVNNNLKIIYDLFNKFRDYTINYLNAYSTILDQNSRIINYICNGNECRTIDANKIINEPENDINEATLLITLDSAYREAYENALELEALSESAGLIALEEAGKLNIGQYITKVSKGIKAAWDKFKTKVDDLKKKAMLKYINKYKQNAESLPEDYQFTVKNYPVIDKTAFNTVHAVPFNYQEMKDSLKSEDTYAAKYYPNIRKEGVPFKQALEGHLVKNHVDIRITKQYITEDILPIFEEAKDIIEESIKSDLETVNKSNEAIARLSTNNNGGTNNTPPNIAPNESAIITEAENDNKKPEIVDDPNRQATADTNSTLKDISVYLKVSAVVLSTKMKVASQRKLLAFRVLAHTFAPPKKNKEQNEG